MSHEPAIITFAQNKKVKNMFIKNQIPIQKIYLLKSLFLGSSKPKTKDHGIALNIQNESYK